MKQHFPGAAESRGAGKEKGEGWSEETQEKPNREGLRLRWKLSISDTAPRREVVVFLAPEHAAPIFTKSRTPNVEDGWF